MKLLVIDNYDSFTYNLIHLIEKVSSINIDLVKNDKIKLDHISIYDKILLSPGPGLPSKAGILPQVINCFYKTKSILGVCLGHQAIGEAFNSPLKNASPVWHGVASNINVITKDKIFNNCPKKFVVGRYHSWLINEQTIHPNLIVTAIDDQNNIMAIKHKFYNVRGVQFHPESILSEYGETIIENWLSDNE